MVTRAQAGWGLAYATGYYHLFDRASELDTTLHLMVHRYDTACGSDRELHRPDIVWFPGDAPPDHLCCGKCMAVARRRKAAA